MPQPNHATEFPPMDWSLLPQHRNSRVCRSDAKRVKMAWRFPLCGVHEARVHWSGWLMTGETIPDLLQPLIGKSGLISMVVGRTGPIGLVTTENEKLTGVEVRPDGLVRVERETGWAVVDPGDVVAVVWDSEPKASAVGQFL